MTRTKKILVIEKRKNVFIFYFFIIKSSNIISKLRIFFEVLYISVGPKIKILESHSNFRDLRLCVAHMAQASLLSKNQMLQMVLLFLSYRDGRVL